MEIDLLKEEIRAAKLHPIQVDGEAIDENGRGHRFVGSLEEYLDALRVISAVAVFIRVDVFDEFHFFHASELESEVSDDETDPVDLRSRVEGLRGFEIHLGSISSYRLSASLTSDSLDFVINEPWWIEFVKLRVSAGEEIDDELKASAARTKEDQQSRDRTSLAALNALIKDPHFTRLPTQKAMIAYAVEQIPELNAVDPNALKAEIQNLHAKIKAKGLDQKR